MNDTETVILAGPAPDPAVSPAFLIAVASLLLGGGLATAGVFTLFGAGWAMLCGSLAPLGISFTLFRGLSHGR